MEGKFEKRRKGRIILISESLKRITDQIIGSLQGGFIPWKKPWQSGFPKNLVSKKPYRGINVFLLLGRHFESPWWGTKKQIERLGGSIKDQEKPFFVVFWGWFKTFDSNSSEKVQVIRSVPFLRLYLVFNLNQCTGIEPPEPIKTETPVETAEIIIGNYQHCKTFETLDKAAYSPTSDVIYMPKRKLFSSETAYYSTYFHEISHSTGHPSRLDRDGFEEAIINNDIYSKEELIAEMSACFLCAEAGIENPENFENQTAYIDSWLRILRADSKILFSSASEAQKVVDFVLGRRVVLPKKKRKTRK